jgi:hypothetical protein
MNSEEKRYLIVMPICLAVLIILISTATIIAFTAEKPYIYITVFLMILVWITFLIGAVESIIPGMIRDLKRFKKKQKTHSHEK